jgi:hypothetical protein
MKLPLKYLCAAAMLVAGASTDKARAVSLSYVGSDYDLTNLFPGGGPADVNSYVVVPWRSDYAVKQFDGDGDNVYGTAGYALFGTRFDYPNANATSGNAFVDPTDDSVFPNIISLPSFVSGSQILSTRKAGGWAYSLIDDPQLTNGVRDWNWGDTQTPASAGQAPYVKLGILDGNGALTGNNPATAPAERWGFQVGAGFPAKFRVSVMTDGLDATQWAPTEVLMQQSSGGALIGTPVTTGTVTPNRFVDMHVFEINGAQAGEEFVFMVRGVGGGSAGVAGFAFDIVSDVAGDNADFDGNGVVDGDDFLAWQRGFGGSGGLADGDANNDGVVDAADLGIWKTQFGTGAASVAAGAVPEPTAAALFAIALIGAIGFRK